MAVGEYSRRKAAHKEVHRSAEALRPPRSACLAVLPIIVGINLSLENSRSLDPALLGMMELRDG